MTAALAQMRRAGHNPIGVFVFVGKPPKWAQGGPDSIVVLGKPEFMDWRPVIGLHVDVIEVGDQRQLLRDTVVCIEAAKARSIGMACRAGIAGLNPDHERLLHRLQRRLHAFPA